MIFKGNDNYYLMATSAPHAGRSGEASSAGPRGGVRHGALAVNTWTHLATTYDGTTLRLYVNGVQVASTARRGRSPPPPARLQIGGDAIFGQYFAGRIDEVRVYNAALTAPRSRRT